uniref:CAZy families GH18 protein n=1 Tax=uncultured Saccharopolyspora sp. TaxID=498730 RepID=A0A060CGN2_9PSEU|nr:CAZy families GH18 protein [uncultured Saccharopolyspora sp.]
MRGLARPWICSRSCTYDYSWSTSEAGPIAPIPWAHDVIAYATSVVPAEKVYLGLPFYAYDWLAKSGESKVWTQVQVLLDRHDPEVERDESNEGHFTYGDLPPAHGLLSGRALA